MCTLQPALPLDAIKTNLSRFSLSKRDIRDLLMMKFFRHYYIKIINYTFSMNMQIKFYKSILHIEILEKYFK